MGTVLMNSTAWLRKSDDTLTTPTRHLQIRIVTLPGEQYMNFLLVHLFFIKY